MIFPARLARASLLVVLAGGAASAAAQGSLFRLPTPSPAAAATPPAPAPVSRDDEALIDSPRSSVADFMALTNRGKYADAAAFLDLSPSQESRGPELARRLRAVLDRYLRLDDETLSAVAEGDENDGQARGVEQVGMIPVGDRREPVRLVRREGADRSRWIFSRGTVGRIDGWYEGLGDRWVREHLPDWLLRMGPFKILRWQWLALLPLLFIAYWAGRILAWPVRFAVKRFAAFTSNKWDDALVGKLRGIAALAIMLVVTEALLPFLELGRGAQVWTSHALRAWGLLIFFMALMRAVDVVGDGLKSASFSLGNPSARSALAIATRTAKVAVVLFGILATLLEMGYPVASILAGIGIGGLGLALAAQKTVENLFGSVSLAADEAIRLGDTVRLDTLVGSVEGIGLRSTRIRTPERTVVTIPNGLLAGQRIESLTARDRMRLHCRLALTLGTTPEQIHQVLTGCERVLRAQETLWPHDVGVRFVEIGTVSLDVEVSAWFVVTWEEFTAIRQEVLLRFLEVVKEAGTSLARSTTSITVVPADPSASPEPAPTR